MVKEPRAGFVKTRLGNDIGIVPATWWFRHQVAGLTRRLASPKWDMHLAVAPDIAVATPMLPPVRRVPQGTGDLGARMARLFQSADPGPVAIIGADIPTIQKQDIGTLFGGLGSHDVMIGPAWDGGFWGIGLRRGGLMPRRGFGPVRWSTAKALEDTQKGLAGLHIGFGRKLRDVDVGADLAFATDLDRKP